MTFSGNVDHVTRSGWLRFGDVQIWIQECVKHIVSPKHHSGRLKEEMILTRMLITVWGGKSDVRKPLSVQQHESGHVWPRVELKITRQIWRWKDLRGFDPWASKDQGQWALKIKQPAVLGCNKEVDNIHGGWLVLGASHKMCANGLLGGGLCFPRASVVSYVLWSAS